MKKKTTILMILDGLGLSDKVEGNAVRNANIPNIRKILAENPNTILHASEEDVGLPKGQMGNSEVGHSNLGAGRVVEQDSFRITQMIESGDFFSNPKFIEAIENCKKNNSALHLIGLLSDGGVHSHIRHLYALLELARRRDFSNVFIHCFMDGRDTPPASGEGFIIQLEKKIQEKKVGKIATISGRYYAMDRHDNWDRVQKAYNLLVKGEGFKSRSGTEAIEESYQKEVFDEYVQPTVIVNASGEPIATIKENDSVIFFNYRSDRAKELTRAFVDPEFDGFKRKYIKTHFVTMTEYDKKIPNVISAYKTLTIRNTIGETLSNLGYMQLRIAETEKYEHVTYFFNGKSSRRFKGESHVLVNSPNVKNYELTPEMSAEEITNKAVEAIESGKYDFIVVNYANADVIGHTGNLEAAERALEFLDGCVQKVYKCIIDNDGVLLITSDHGNCEQQIDTKTGEPYTANTTNPVPLAIVGKKFKLREGRLCDIAPTILEIMNIEKPQEMTGESLIVRQ